MLRLPTGYAVWITALKARVRSAQLRAAARVNRELILLYWDIGRSILRQQQNEGWGAKVVERLAADLKAEFPEMAGFSRANLLFMRSFAEAWLDPATAQQPVALPNTSPSPAGPPIVLQPVRQLAPGGASPQSAAIVQQPVGQPDAGPPEPMASLPWGHNLLLLHKLQSPADRRWYAQAAADNGWSRSVLAVQIAQRAHRRAGRAVTNFAATLPPPQSDLAQQTLRDPYVFDFLTLSTAARERELEQGLIDHVQQFLVSLGAGFAFVGRQVHLEVGGEDYYLDLLFYHLKLRCFVVIDLKAREFTPEAAGKMNFYLSAVDDRLRHRDDQPSIGLLLCRGKNRLTVEYALRDVKKPIGVAEWRTRLVASLPKALRSSLPTVAEIEAELGLLRSSKSG